MQDLMILYNVYILIKKEHVALINKAYMIPLHKMYNEMDKIPCRKYTGESVKILGITTVEVKYGEQCTHLTVSTYC